MTKLFDSQKTAIREAVALVERHIKDGYWAGAHGTIRRSGGWRVQRSVLRITGFKRGNPARWYRGGPSNLSYVEGVEYFHPEYKNGRRAVGLF